MRNCNTFVVTLLPICSLLQPKNIKWPRKRLKSQIKIHPTAVETMFQF